MRPGEFDPPNAKGPSPYYDCVRFYAKIYNKIADNLDPTRGQLSEDSANILAVSFYSPRAPLWATSSGVGWALDELFADQPKSGMRLKEEPPGRIDISLMGWLEFTASDLHQTSGLDLKRYTDAFHEVVGAPKKIGGVLLLDGCALKASRVNYSARASCSVSHQEISEFEELLGNPPVWWRP